MVRATVALVLLLLACVYAAPGISLVKNSSFGIGAAAAGSKSSGVVESNTNGETPNGHPSRGSGDMFPDIAVVDNVNAGGAFAAGDSMSTGVVKNNRFKDKNPFFPVK